VPNPVHKPCQTSDVYVLGLCLTAILATGCSFDASKLRQPAMARDAAVEYSTGSDALLVYRDGATDDVPGTAAGRDTGGTTTGDGGAETLLDAVPRDLIPSMDAGKIVDLVSPAEVADQDAVGGEAGGSSGEDTSDVASTGGNSDGSDGPNNEASQGDGDAPNAEDAPEGDSSERDLPTDTAEGPAMDAAVSDAREVDVGGSTVPDPDLVLWYRFDESSGTTAYDSALFGGVSRNATLTTIGTSSTALFSTSRQLGSHALVLTPSSSSTTSGAYVVIPALDTLAPDALTIGVWVNLAANTSNQNWERIWDFGDSSTAPRWLNLTARSGASPNGPVFAMSKIGHTTSVEELLSAPAALSANAWHHIAVVLPSGTTYAGVLYVDGVAVATNNAMTVHLSDIGATANNSLGRSQFSSDPYFNGSLDDFRVYRRALSQKEITALVQLR